MKQLLLSAAILLLPTLVSANDVLSRTSRSTADAASAPRMLSPERDGFTTRGLGTRAAARAALDRYAATFDGGIDATYSELAGSNRIARGDGKVVAVRYRQAIGGVPVFGAQLVATVRPDGRVATLAGEVSRTHMSAIDLVPTIGQADALHIARQVAAKHAHRDVSALDAQVEGLRIYDPALVGFGSSVADASVAWEISVRSTTGAPVRQTILIDAREGQALLGYSTLHAARDERTPRPASAARSTSTSMGKALGTPVLETYSAENDVLLPGVFLCGEDLADCTGGVDVDADNAHRFARGVYDLYATLHQRDSIDGMGLPLVSTVHFDSGLCNAFWDSAFLQMIYGDGCDIVLDDVVGHELTHGVTDFTSGLIYAYESGAINESLSDVWGEYYDLSNASPDDTAEVRWVIGEEVDGGIRNMRDPGAFFDPDRMLSPNFWIDPLDIGGVHFNSGVNNKAAYLLADGDSFNGQTIEGLGLEKPLHLYYYVQTTLLTPTSNFADLGHYLAEGCSDLIGAHGITAEDCLQVEKAVLATEMRERSPLQPDFAPLCAEDEVANDIVFDDFEDATASKARWSTQADVGDDAWTIASLQRPIDGERSLRADNLPSMSDSSAVFGSGIVVPAGASLHFEHAYAWEYDGYDGSAPQFSTDGGVTWVSFAPELLTGERYPGFVQSDASLNGQLAFAGDSLGVGSTRIDLSSLAGQEIRLRFLASTDQSFDVGTPDGWWIDNVHVYTCGAPPPPGIFADGWE